MCKRSLICLIVTFGLCVNALAKDAQSIQVLLKTPFSYGEKGVPKNVREELAISTGLPHSIAEHMRKNSDVVQLISAHESGTADLVVHGEIARVYAGDRLHRAFDIFTYKGLAVVVLTLKVYDRKGVLLYERKISKRGKIEKHRALVWSNKLNIDTALTAIAEEALPAVLAGNVHSQEGFVKAMRSDDALTMKASLRSFYSQRQTGNPTIARAMDDKLRQALDQGVRKNKYYIDAIAWCARNLGHSGLPQYQALLEEVANSNLPRKIRSRAKSAAKRLEP